MKKISVIIPIYNTKVYLPRCLESVCNQTYQDLEIICVDDGSTDGSEKILDYYTKIDSRIVAIHQKNQGESVARNIGIRYATGDIITFCDCDDWIDFNMYQIMVEAMEEYDVDMVATSWYKEEQKEKKCMCTEMTNRLPVEKGIIDNEQLLKYIYARDSYRGFAYMWNKLYKREIISDKSGNLLLFDETLKLGGDVVYLADAALNTKKAKYIDKAFYHYNQRMSSGCHTHDVNKLRDWIRAYEMVIQKFTQEKVSDVTISYVKRFLAYHSSNAAQIAYEQRDKQYLTTFQELMRQYQFEYVDLNKEYLDRLKRYQEILEYTL